MKDKRKGVTNRVGSPVRGKDFFGRQRFVDLVWQKIMHGNVLLAAPRRFGKTSVMYCLIDEPRYESKVIHADLESVTEPSEMIVQLLEGLAKEESFENSVGKLGFLKQGWDFFRKNFEEIDLYVAKVKLRDAIREDWQIKGKEIFNKVAESESVVIFILDEFPMMLDSMLKNGRKEEAKTLLKWFRSLRLSPDLQDKVRFVIAGSIGIDHVLNQLGEIASINDFEKLKLEPFSAKTANDFLDELCTTHSLPLIDEVKSKLFESVGKPIPYFIQIMFSEIHKTYFQEEEEITVEMVEKIYRDKVLGVDCKTYFEHYYGRLRQYYDPELEKAARKILREIAVSGELKKSTCYQLFTKILGKKGDLEMFGALMTELENDFYVSYKHENDSYEFGSKLLRDWWLRHYGMTIN
ncbi:MAG TPA: hypothetical protein PKY59_20035 [Pyrinomonadaceae bacterium]|nr:hypothetical protein [Pyrinomonadaceae bacterium]